MSKKYYKFTDTQYIISCIENGVYASKLTNVNDLYEAEGMLYPNDYRVCCMTESYLKMLMWAYYGNHKGCCIEYEFDDNAIIDCDIRNVKYIDQFQSHRTMDKTEIRESLYTKGKEWEHENEVRAVWEKGVVSDRWKVNGDDVFLKAKVVSICFGVMAEYTDGYKKALEYLKTYNMWHEKRDVIDVKKVMLRTDKYGLMKDPQYQYLKHLQ